VLKRKLKKLAKFLEDYYNKALEIAKEIPKDKKN